MQRSRFYLTLVSILYSALLDKAGGMVLSTYTKQRVIALHSEGFKELTISKKLWEEAIYMTWVGVHKFLCVYKATHTINRRRGSGHPSNSRNKEEWLINRWSRMKRLLCINSISCLYEIDITFLWVLFSSTKQNWDGHFKGLSIANLSEVSTKRRDWSGSINTLLKQTVDLTTLCGPMKSSFSTTGDS